jgi:DHA1 family tetracycline resistance protein-like MFS transporter
MLKNKSKAIAIIFLIVFIDLVGFGLILPLSSYLAKDFGATGMQIGMLMMIYSLMQFIFSPIWGRLSDKVGRRPILLMSLLCSGLSYVGYSFSTSLTELFIWRALAGVFGANISTAMAYMADISDAKDRSKSMGLVGAAFGLGFMTGPFLGGILGDIGPSISTAPPFGRNFSALIAGIICFVNFIAAYFILKESLTTKSVKVRKSRWELLKSHALRPRISSLLLMGFLTTFAMAHMESTIFLYVMDKFQWSLRFTSFGFAYIGLVIVFTQGFLIRKLLPIYGERILLIAGVLLASVGLLAIPFVTGPYTMALSQTFFAIGTGLINPCLTGSLSLLSGKDEQGEIMGVYQSMSAMGRILGPALGGIVYDQLGHSSPYLLAGAIMLVTVILANKAIAMTEKKA